MIDALLAPWERMADAAFREAGIVADARELTSTARTLRRLEPVFTVLIAADAEARPDAGAGTDVGAQAELNAKADAGAAPSRGEDFLNILESLAHD